MYVWRLCPLCNQYFCERNVELPVTCGNCGKYTIGLCGDLDENKKDCKKFKKTCEVGGHSDKCPYSRGFL